ncbi:hypothetical protein PR202_gb12891 [Eleusine coracana subsp. coracana]|uniref:Disease resistance protein winged helix domain-containing protein n=1 Tax=Eleusine coracana subsp. coracana TaxID=191504 RepID=A0AAV5EP31_ELECO|nr:hypothetical protein PR202_gb12891 [Eleusine coracana subsp. coracana]
MLRDEFKYKLEDGKHGGFAAKMNKRIRHVKVWHRLTCELRDINADLEDAAKQANLCAIPIIERPGAGNYYHAGSINPTSCFARDEDLVGIEDNAEKLKGWLLDMEEKKSRIVAIWGMGGAEDYEMNRKRLIRHWIAAGFIIVQKGNQALEEVAEGYLNELVNRSLLQVVERNEFGRGTQIKILPDVVFNCKPIPLRLQCHEFFQAQEKINKDNQAKFKGD